MPNVEQSACGLTLAQLPDSEPLDLDMDAHVHRWRVRQDSLTWHVRVDGEAVPIPGNEPCVLGEPPGRLAYLHWPELLNRAIATMQDQLNNCVCQEGDLALVSCSS